MESVVNLGDALAALSSETSGMNSDELRVLTKFAKKIRAGAEKHGHMDLRHDKRNWRRERLAEQFDTACYGAMEEVQQEIWDEDRTIEGLDELRDSAPLPRHWLAESEGV